MCRKSRARLPSLTGKKYSRNRSKEQASRVSKRGLSKRWKQFRDVSLHQFLYRHKPGQQRTASPTDGEASQSRARASHKREKGADNYAEERSVGNHNQAGRHRQCNVGHQ
jgi:hypothetical protein